MLSDITNSIKAKLYDFTYTPFMSSMIIAWIILNHKYLLVYFAEHDLDKKLELLNDHSFSSLIGTVCIPYAMNVWFPIAFGLFYVFVYPWASKIFYEYTLERTKALKEVKQKNEDETPITQEEARQIRSDIEQLTKERDDYRDKALQAERRYEKKYQDRIKELKVTKDKIKKDKSIQTPILYADVPPVLKENDKKKVLRFFYESNYKTESESQVLDNIVQKTGIRRPKAQKVLDDLVEEKTLSQSSDSYKYIEITQKGNSELIELFDKEE